MPSAAKAVEGTSWARSRVAARVMAGKRCSHPWARCKDGKTYRARTRGESGAVNGDGAALEDVEGAGGDLQVLRVLCFSPLHGTGYCGVFAVGAAMAGERGRSIAPAG